MDIALHFFDEYIGDKVYSKLENPFISLLSSTTFSKTSDILGSSYHSTLVSTTSSNFNSNAIIDFLVSLPSLSSLPRDSAIRQSISLYLITYAGILLLYFGIATMSYYFIFDHRMEKHPRFLPRQVYQEIKYSLEAFPMLDLLTLPWFLGDVRGWSMLYDSIEEGPLGSWGGAWPWIYMAASSAVFLLFTDVCIYWIHRWLHIPFFYKRLHKPHHKWIIPTPFASHAFHPIDGYLQSVPYHLTCYLIPIHKYLFIGLFTAVNLWSILIHDSDMAGNFLPHVINGPAHHTLHHMYFTCNYGQYFTWADKFGGSFRLPSGEEDPLLTVLALEEKKRLEKIADSRSASEVEQDEGESSDSEVELTLKARKSQ